MACRMIIATSTTLFLGVDQADANGEQLFWNQCNLILGYECYRSLTIQPRLSGH
jgi:hypothetical protein